MKRISVLFLSLIALVAVFSSCNPSADSPVIGKITPTSDTVYFVTAKAGTEITFSVEVTPDVNGGAKLTTLSWTSDKLDFTGNVDLDNAANTVTKDVKFTVSDTVKTAQVVTITFKVEDDNENSSTKKATIVIMEEPVTIPAIITAAATTVNYSSVSATTDFGWKLSPDAKGVTVTQVDAADADFVFFWNDTYRHLILSPDADIIEEQDGFSIWNYDVTGKKVSKIQASTDAAWTAASDETINNLFVTTATVNSGSNGFDHVAVGDVYAFELSDGRKGLLKVTANDAPYKVEASLSLEFKYQETANSGK